MSNPRLFRTADRLLKWYGRLTGGGRDALRPATGEGER